MSSTSSTKCACLNMSILFVSRKTRRNPSTLAVQNTKSHSSNKRQPCRDYVGQDSSVGIAARYSLEGPGIEYRWGRDFPRPSRPTLGSHPASCTMVTGSLPRVKWPECGVDHPSPSAGVKERVQLQSTPPSGPSCPVLE